MLEAKVALAHVMSQFDFQPSENCAMPPKYKIRVTQSIYEGLPVYVKDVEAAE